MDPIARTLEVLRLESGVCPVVGVHADHDVVRAEPFAETALELAALWGQLP